MVLFLVLPNHQYTLKMGTDLVSESFENLHILTRLSARKYFIDLYFFTTYIDYRSLLLSLFFSCSLFSALPLFILYFCISVL